MLRPGWLAMALLLLALPIPGPAGDEPKTLDNGLLAPAWFGPGVVFHSASMFDYVYVKPEFDIKGKTLRVGSWPDPVFLGKER